VATFEESKPAKRINNALGPHRGAVNEAVADDLLPSNSLDRFRVKRRAKANTREEVDSFTPEEVQAIPAACRKDQVRNCCQFSFATGLQTSIRPRASCTYATSSCLRQGQRAGILYIQSVALSRVFGSTDRYRSVFKK